MFNELIVRNSLSLDLAIEAHNFLDGNVVVRSVLALVELSGEVCKLELFGKIINVLAICYPSLNYLLLKLLVADEVVYLLVDDFV